MLVHLIKISRLLLFFLCVVCVTTFNALAQHTIDSPEKIFGQLLYCLDIQGNLTLNQVKACDFVKRTDLTGSAHLGAVVWVKIPAEEKNQIKNASFSIHIAPHMIQRIELFDGDSGRLVMGPSGTDYPFDPSTDVVGGYTFTINKDRLDSDALYLRIATAGLPFVIVTVSEADRMALENMNQQIGLGLHLGALGLIFVVSTVVYWAGKNRVVGCFALLVLNLIFATLSGSGLLMKYVWGDYPKLNELFFNSMLYLRLGFWTLLAQAFLSHYVAPQWYRKSCVTIYSLVVLSLVLSWFNYSQVSNFILLIGITIVPIVQVFAIQMTRHIERSHKITLMCGYLIGFLLIWATLLITIFPISDPALSIYLVRIVDFVNPMVLLLLVFSDHRQLANMHAETRRENFAIKMRLDFEQKLKNERKILIDMLTHELKNPLASISMAIGSLASFFTNEHVPQKRRLHNITHSIRSMDTVIERCNLMNQLDHQSFSLQASELDLGVIVDQVLAQCDHDQRVTVDLQGPEHFVTDAYLFKTICINLLENALKYSPADSNVTLSLKRGGSLGCSALIMNVTNDIGTNGFPASDKVFTRFYRHPRAFDTSGSGIGLFLVRELTLLLKGHVQYQADESVVSFTVELPEHA